MLILRIRQAEVAAGAGRLDEAYELATRDGRFRSHRRGQEAITRIIAALVRRGREHLSAGRLPQAGADCEKAGKLGGDVPDVAQLAVDLRAAQENRQRGHRDASLAVAAARQHVQAGMLSVGERILTNVDDSRAKRLMNDIDEHRVRLETALASARTAAGREDWGGAAQAIARARVIRASDGELIDLTRKVADALSNQAKAEIAQGRLDRASETASILVLADPDSPLVRDVRRALDDCRRAWICMEQARPHDAADLLRRVVVLFPATSWITESIQQLQAAGEAMARLRAGPLSLAADATALPDAADLPQLAHPALVAAERGRNVGSTTALPERFILQVDGAGAFLVVRSVVAKIGAISSSTLPDIALIADATAPTVTLERVEDDYFLRSGSRISVNDKPITDALLSTGDRIELSPRCRFTFSLPHPASTTAVLDLTGARYPRGDVRRVILLDRDLILGPGPASHVRVNGLAQPVVINLRGGLLRTSVEATIEGRPIGREEGLPLGVQVIAGGASFVISKV